MKQDGEMKYEIATEILIVDVNKCARCGFDHKAMEFRPFISPNEHYSHWAMCNGTDEPILLKIINV